MRVCFRIFRGYGCNGGGTGFLDADRHLYWHADRDHQRLDLWRDHLPDDKWIRADDFVYNIFWCDLGDSVGEDRSDRGSRFDCFKHFRSYLHDRAYGKHSG